MSSSPDNPTTTASPLPCVAMPRSIRRPLGVSGRAYARGTGRLRNRPVPRTEGEVVKFGSRCPESADVVAAGLVDRPARWAPAGGRADDVMEATMSMLFRREKEAVLVADGFAV